MLKRFSHVMMYVADLDRAVAWYTKKWDSEGNAIGLEEVG